jgi:hypothetical protein
MKSVEISIHQNILRIGTQYYDGNGCMAIGEVRYFTMVSIAGIDHAVAVVSRYGQPNSDLWEQSFHTYWTAEYLGDANIEVIKIKDIQSTVMMAPDKQYQNSIQDGTENNRWYLMERPGLKLTELPERPENYNYDD